MLKPKIINMKQRFTENMVLQWTNSIKTNNLPLYTLFPMYDIATQLERRKKNKKEHPDDVILGCKQSLFIPNQHNNSLSHICFADLNTQEKSLSINKIIMNPSIILYEDNLNLNTTINLKKTLNNYSFYYNYYISYNNVYKWDNGRFLFLLNEDIFLN